MELRCAFDSVWHDGLVYKMSVACFPIYIVKIIKSFLQGRSFRVKVASQFSDRREIAAAVPQGAVLSPLPFNIFMAVSKIVSRHNLPMTKHLLLQRRELVLIRKRLNCATKTFSKFLKN